MDFQQQPQQPQQQNRPLDVRSLTTEQMQNVYRRVQQLRNSHGEAANPTAAAATTTTAKYFRSSWCSNFWTRCQWW
ncbi:unnamed protein product [Ambrosiozyma monospora]|uniref:Unnamed protein product n=1 Tax=Ambrosiozyma monospora TaxID=43982 RepID=A0ACB5T7G1_AMBMO|nr:unnamed protein product [Ambrosiozyma monospora]